MNGASGGEMRETQTPRTGRQARTRKERDGRWGPVYGWFSGCGKAEHLTQVGLVSVMSLILLSAFSASQGTEAA